MEQRLIDANALKDDLRESYNALKKIYDGLEHNEDRAICGGQLSTFLEAILRVKEAPTVDVVPVVRCKDCKWWEKRDFQAGNDIERLEYGGRCPNRRFAVYESDFCSNGERRIDHV